MDEKTPQPGATAEELLGKEVSEEFSPFIKKAMENLKAIIAGVVLLLVVTGGYGIYKSVTAKNLAKAVNDLGLIMVQEDGADKIAALDGFLATAPAGLKGGVLLEIARVSEAAKDYDRAVKAWRDVAAMGVDTLTPVAKLGEAAALAAAGKPAEALPLLESLKASAPKSYTSSVLEKIAAVAEASGDLQKAVAAFEELKNADADQANKSYYDGKIAALSARITKG
ncbi:MAG: tetratricopeptide repeat protein [Desulfovibrionaceae bacterium]